MPLLISLSVLSQREKLTLSRQEKPLDTWQLTWVSIPSISEASSPVHPAGHETYEPC